MQITFFPGEAEEHTEALTKKPTTSVAQKQQAKQRHRQIHSAVMLRAAGEQPTLISGQGTKNVFSLSPTKVWNMTRAHQKIIGNLGAPHKLRPDQWEKT